MNTNNQYKDYIVSSDDDGMGSFSQKHLLDKDKKYILEGGEYVEVSEIPKPKELDK